MNAKNRNILFVLLIIFVGLYIGLLVLLYARAEAYAIHEAEKQGRDMLYTHRAVHAYVTKIQRPEIFRLQAEGQLDKDYFSPKVLSFTYIARNVMGLVNDERRQHGLPEIYFKLASDNPRNPVNQADAEELELLKRINRGELQEYRQVTQRADGKWLYLAVPVQVLSAGCLKCHGNPLDAPRDLVQQYGDKAGFFEQAGRYRAFISIRVPLFGVLEDAKHIFNVIAVAALVSLTLLYLLIFGFFRYLDNKQRIILEQNVLLKQLASTDPLTGVYNRNGLLPLIGHYVSMEERDRKPLALMMMDLDLFKAINDTYGHGVGDEVLRHFATLVQENVRAADIVGRWGGEEFIVMMPGQTMEEARDGAERVRAAVERATLSEGVRITVSIGLASFHGDDTVDSWIQRADLALYASKASGRNRVSVETA